jgi:hypothetical protein
LAARTKGPSPASVAPAAGLTVRASSACSAREVERWHGADMARTRREGKSAPMTLGNALAAKVLLIVSCKTCGHRAEPDVANQVAQHGEAMTVINWGARLRCSGRGGREVDSVVSGPAR